MKKLLLTGIVIVVFVLYAIYHSNATAVVPSTTNKNNGTTVSDNSSSSTYKDGTYKGSGADAFYGTIQVQATIQNGKVTDVQFLQYPNDQEESKQVSAMAMPQLKQEAIQAQSAKVAVVTGATQTSQAFMQSLTNALSQAKS